MDSKLKNETNSEKSEGNELVDHIGARQDPFKRRDSIARTPPGNETPTRTQESETLVDEQSMLQVLLNENTAEVLRKASKRLRDEDESERELRKQFDRLVKTVNDLVEATRASTKTKIEIKNMVKKLKRQTNDVCKEWEEVDKKEKSLKPRTEVKEMKSVSVQADLEDIRKEYEGKKLMTINRIKAAIDENGTYNKLTEVLDEKWPQEFFKITETDGGNQMEKTSYHGDYAILIEPTRVKNNKFAEDLMFKYIGLAEMIEISEGHADFLIQTIKTKSKTNEYEEKSSAVHLLPLQIDIEGVHDVQTIYNRIAELRENIQMHPTGNINLIISEGLNFSYVRKICEYVFARDTIKIRLTSQGQRTALQRHKTKQESTVTVKAEGKSFVDIVKRLKEEVNIDQLGVKIKKLQKTEKGDLRLTIHGGQDMAMSLKNEITHKINDVQVMTRKLGTTTIYISGMDPTIEEEEVKQAIAAVAKMKETDIDIKSVREGRYGEKTVIAEVPREQIMPLIGKKRLKIGWMEGTVKERIDIVRCFRCLEHGHKTLECKAQVDRSRDCIKCGRTGHKSKECINTYRCLKCNMDGHRADQMKCPYLKKLVEETRIVGQIHIHES